MPNPSMIQNSREIIVVDWTVGNYKSLTKGVPPNTPVILLEKGNSGLAGLAKALEPYKELDAIHLVTHGQDGYIQLGDQQVNIDTLNAQQPHLKSISDALKTGGDLMLYGCSVAASESGKKLIYQLSEILKDVDIAASTDNTGAAELGGDWDLEWSSGSIQAKNLAEISDIYSFGGLLTSTFIATSEVQVISGSNSLDGGSNPISVLGAIGLSDNSRALLLADTKGAYVIGNHPNYEDLKIAIVDTSNNVTIKSVSSEISTVINNGYYTGQTNDQATLIALKNGGMVVTASSNSGYAVQMLDNSGNNIPIAKPSSFTSSVNPNARAIATEDGGFVLIWTTNNYTDLRFQRYDENGAQVGSTLTYSQSTTIGSPNIYFAAVDENGNIAVPYSSTNVFTKGKVRIWDTSNNLTATVEPAYYQNSALISAKSGGGFVLFGNDLQSDNGNTSTGFHIQTLSADGSLGTVIQNVVPNTSWISSAQLLSSGDYIVSESGSNKAHIVSGSSPSSATTYSIFTTVDSGKFTATPSVDFDGEITAAWVIDRGYTNVEYMPGWGYDFLSSASVSVVTYNGAAATPSTPSSPDMSSASDNGISSTDNLTSDTTPTFTITGVTSGNTVTIFRDANDNGILDAGEELISGTASGSSIELTASALPDGTHKIRAVQIADGTSSSASEALTITIDTMVPAVPPAPDMSAGSDTGASNTDNLTNDSTPTFIGTAEPNATITLYSGSTSVGTATADGSGNWSITTSPLSQGAHSITVKATDGAGNESTASSVLDITVDTTAPTLSGSDSSNLSQTSASVSSSSNEAGTLYYVVTTSSTSPTPAQILAGNNDTGSTAVASGSGSVSADTAKDFSVSGLTAETSYYVYFVTVDAAGNLSSVSSDSFTTPANGPVVTDTHISITSTPSGTSSTYRIGDTITAQWDNSASGQNQSGITAVSMDFSAFGGSNAVTATNNGSGLWSASYTLASGSIDASNLNVSVSATDSNGTTTTTDSSNLSADSQAATVTDGHLSISGASGTGGAFRIGDTVTAIWNNTAGGDNNSDSIGSVTFDFSQFGGGTAVTAANSGGTWIAAYTLTAGSIDATNRNVSASVTDNAGNATTRADSSNATVDTQVPTVTAANLSLSGATGNDGVFKAGDTVTATWNNTGTGDNNGDTISGVTFDFSQFGGGAAVAATNSGGTWTATYTITAGSIDATSRNVSATVTDNAGNATTTAGTDNVTVDNQAPTAPGTPDLHDDSDNGSSNTDNLTSDTTPTLTGSGALANGTVTLYSGGTVLGITTADASGNWSFTPGSALAAGTHSITVTTTDAVGNVSAASAALSLNIDTSAPVIGSVSIPAAPMKIGDVVTATITVTSDTDSYTLSNGSIGGFPLGSLTKINDTTYTATFTVTSGGTDVAAGSDIPVSLVFTDGAGNSNTAYTTAISQSGDAINASAPTDIALSNANLSTSASANSTVGTLSSTDATPGDTFTYALVTGDGATDNASFAIVGNQLQAIDPAAMTAGSKSIRVQTTDAAGNTYVEQMGVTVTTNPTVTITSSASTLKAGETATLTFTFSETPSGFEDGDITITGGTLSGLTVDSGNDKVYTATFTPDADAQSLSGSLSIAAGTFKNASDEDNLASNTLTISGDTLRPTITSIERQTPALETTNADTLVYRVTFSEAVTGVDTADFAVSGTTASVSSVVSAGGNAYELTLSGGDLSDLNATVTLSLASGQNITDSAGNTLSNTTPGTNQVTYIVDNTAPSLNTAGSTPSDNATTASIGSALTLRFSEALAGTSDLTGVYLRNSDTDALVPATVTLNGNGELVITPSAALAYSTAYYVSWDAGALKDAAGNTMAAVGDKTTFNFTTTSAPSSDGGTPTPPVTPVIPPRDSWTDLPDNDGDGIPEQVENLVPSLGGGVAGDGNGDGIPDIQQSEVASVPFRNTQQVSQDPDAPVVFVTLVGGSENGVPRSESSVKITSAQQLDAPADKPADLAMPLGLIGFTAVAASSGSTETFSLLIDGDIAINGYWKQNTQGTWVNLASAEYGGRVVTENGKTRLDFTITDGGQFDDDGKADGIISDPGAPGWFGSADSDKDQFPDTLEAQNGLSVGTKDNDVFTSSKFFVMQLYRDIHGREADQEGLLYWQQKIDSGTLDRAQVASAVLDSAEFQAGAGAIARLYFGALDRLPDNDGLHFWRSQLQENGTLSRVAESFATSTEFATRYGSQDNAGFVDQLYLNTLGRTADSNGKAYWLGQLAGGLSKGNALLSFTESAEYRQATDAKVTLTLNYVGLLGRSPEQQGFDYWLQMMNGSHNEAQVIRSFLATTEYHDRFLPAGEIGLLGNVPDSALL